MMLLVGLLTVAFAQYVPSTDCGTEKTACDNNVACAAYLAAMSSITAPNGIVTSALAVEVSQAEFNQILAAPDATAQGLLRTLLTCDANAGTGAAVHDYTDYVYCHDLTFSCKQNVACATGLTHTVTGYAVDSNGIPTFAGVDANGTPDICLLSTTGAVVQSDPLFGGSVTDLPAIIECQASLKGLSSSFCITSTYDCQTELNACYADANCQASWEASMGASIAFNIPVETTNGKMEPVLAADDDEGGCAMQFALMFIGQNMQALSLGECYKSRVSGMDNVVCSQNTMRDAPCAPYLYACMTDTQCWADWTATTVKLVEMGHDLDRRGLPVMADENGPRKATICDASTQGNEVGNIKMTTMAVCVLEYGGLQPVLKSCIDDVMDEIMGALVFFAILIVLGYLISMCITGLSCKYCGCDCCVNQLASKGQAVRHES